MHAFNASFPFHSGGHPCVTAGLFMMSHVSLTAISFWWRTSGAGTLGGRDSSLS